MWTKIQSQADVNQLTLNSRLLKFTGDGTPQDPPPNDPSYTLFVLHQNTNATSSLSKTGQNPLFSSSVRANPVPADDDATSTSSLSKTGQNPLFSSVRANPVAADDDTTSSLSKTGQNPLFSSSFAQVSPVELPVSAEEMIEEGIWWFKNSDHGELDQQNLM
jgi:hypothetical protein